MQQIWRSVLQTGQQSLLNQTSKVPFEGQPKSPPFFLKGYNLVKKPDTRRSNKTGWPKNRTPESIQGQEGQPQRFTRPTLPNTITQLDSIPLVDSDKRDCSTPKLTSRLLQMGSDIIITCPNISYYFPKFGVQNQQTKLLNHFHIEYIEKNNKLPNPISSITTFTTSI